MYMCNSTCSYGMNSVPYFCYNLSLFMVWDQLVGDSFNEFLFTFVCSKSLLKWVLH